eukprot:361678-Chlamydomonas_euryale.AAC.2
MRGEEGNPRGKCSAAILSLRLQSCTQRVQRPRHRASVALLHRTAGPPLDDLPPALPELHASCNMHNASCASPCCAGELYCRIAPLRPAAYTSSTTACRLK